MSMHRRKIMMAAKEMPKKGMKLSKTVGGKLNKAAEKMFYGKKSKS